MSESCSYHVGGCLAAFAAGALIGAGIVLFYAPHSGKETRDLLAQRTRDAKDKVEGVLQSAKDRVGGALHDAREMAGSALAGAKEAIQEKKAEIVAAVVAGREAMREQRTASADPG